MKPILILAAAAALCSPAVAGPPAPVYGVPLTIAQSDAAPASAPQGQGQGQGTATDAGTVGSAGDGPSARPALPPIPGRAGPYLAARLAGTRNDYAPAAQYFRQAVRNDPGDQFLQDGALVAMISAGEMDEAVALSNSLVQAGKPTELAGLVRVVDLARRGDWAGVLKGLDDRPSSASAAGPLLDGMIRAWAQLGAGRAGDAFATLERLAKTRGAAGIARYQLALAKASVGDYEAAEKALRAPDASGHLGGITAHVEVLSQLERPAEAIKVLDAVEALETEPTLKALRDRLAVGETLPFDVVSSPVDGLAQVFVTFGGVLMGGEDTDPLALIYARLAQYLDPRSTDAQLLAAQLLQSAGQFDLAEKEFDGLRAKGDLRPAAEMARIDALARAGRSADAETAARHLTDAWPDLAASWMALGDLLRQDNRFAEAVPVYDKAVSLLQKDGDSKAGWFALYARGIALERTGQFDRADADFEAALKLQPEQAPILNYLGYSWVDRNIRLNEGLSLIERAVALRPDDAYILDSLAWAHFRMGHYAQAVEPMEKAVAAMSSDSLVNDHMGDIYWMVGRKREAEIQWKRALSLYKPEDTDTDPNRVRAKLELGLDAVLAAEKANGGVLPKGFGQPAAPAADAPPVDAPQPGAGDASPGDGAPPRP